MALKERLDSAREQYRSAFTEAERLGVIDGEAFDSEMGRDSRRSQPRGGRRVLAAAVIVLVVIGAVAVTGLAIGEGPWSEDPAQPVVAVPPTQPTKSNDPSPNGAIAQWSPEIVLDPAGPYADGDVVTVSVPKGFGVDFDNGGARLCAVLADGPDGPGEWCDQWGARWVGPGSIADTSAQSVTRSVFTPTGYRDCEDPEVTCRLVVRGANGDDFASGVLRFEGSPMPSPGEAHLTSTGSPGVARLRLVGVEIDPTWLEERDQDPAGVADDGDISVQVCAFGEPTLPVDPWGSQLWTTSPIGDTEGRRAVTGTPRVAPYVNCGVYHEVATIDPDRPAEPTNATLPTLFLGYEGWSDCREDHCFIVVSFPTQVVSVLIPPDLVGPTGARPELRILTPGPHVAGQELEVEIANLPEEFATSIGVCRVEDPWGCGYLGGPGGPEGFPDGIHTITLPENFACPTKCYLELDSQGEGMPPLATAALDPG